MATVGYTVENLIGGVKVVTWTPLVAANLDGTPFSLDTNAWISSNGKLHQKLVGLLS